MELYKNNNIKFETILFDDHFEQYEIKEGEKIIGLLTVYGEERIYKEKDIYFTWVFFDEQDRDDLIYFIQKRESDSVDRIEKKIFSEDGSIYDYKTKVIVNGKEFNSICLGHDFWGGLHDK